MNTIFESRDAEALRELLKDETAYSKRVESAYQDAELSIQRRIPSIKNGILDTEALHSHYQTHNLSGIEYNAASKIIEITHNCQFVDEILNFKILFLIDSLKYSLDKKNPVALINGARSLLEHVATRHWIFKMLFQLMETLESEKSESKVIDNLERSTQKIQKLYSGRNGITFNILEYIRSFDKEYRDDNKRNGPLEAYNKISQYLHPNPESYALFSSGEISTGEISNEFKHAYEGLQLIIRELINTLLVNLDLRNGVTEGSAALLVSVEKLVGVDGITTRLRNISKIPKHEGNGASQETAIFFPQVPHSVAVRSSQRIVLKKGIDPKSRELVSINGYYTERYKSNSCYVWFKFLPPSARKDNKGE